jgi:hypothetical protein
MISLETNIAAVLTPIIAKLESNELADRVAKVVASEMLGEIRVRIHQEGKAADGNDIGQYSTEPLYVGVKQNQNIGRSFGAPLGKEFNGKRRSKFESGKKAGQQHASRYFADGYKGYKTTIGRNQLGRVNLSLSGQLDAQLVLIQSPLGWGLGWFDSEKYKRAVALQAAKYKKKIWALTSEEAEKAVSTAEREVLNAFS